jgi:hypothetical protein
VAGSHQLIQVVPMNVRVGVDGHASKFQAEETSPHVANAFLLEQNRAGRNGFNERSYEQAGRNPTN